MSRLVRRNGRRRDTVEHPVEHPPLQPRHRHREREHAACEDAHCANVAEDKKVEHSILRNVWVGAEPRAAGDEVGQRALANVTTRTPNRNDDHAQNPPLRGG